MGAFELGGEKESVFENVAYYLTTIKGEEWGDYLSRYFARGEDRVYPAVGRSLATLKENRELREAVEDSPQNIIRGFASVINKYGVVMVDPIVHLIHDLGLRNELNILIEQHSKILEPEIINILHELKSRLTSLPPLQSS